MTKNLFVCPLADVSAADVRAFLNLDADLDARPPETQLLEFKSGWIDDLGDWVAAFANTSGGVILLGVEEKTGKGNRPIAAPGVEHQGDLRGRIENHIESTVRPRPRYEVHTVPTEGDREIGIVRVEEGDLPPYMYTRDGRNRVPVRVGTSTKPADYLQLDGLIRRRAAADQLAGEGAFPELDHPLSPSLVAPVDGLSVPFQCLYARVGRSAVPLHAAQEGAFRHAIGQTFIHDRASVVSRHLRSIDLAPVASEQFPRIWQLTSGGLIAFGSRIDLPGETRASLFEMVADAIAFARLVLSLTRTLQLHGRVLLRHDIDAEKVTLSNETGENHVSGVSDINRPGSGHRTPWEAALDLSELKEPAEVVALSFADLLRGQWGARVNVAKLAEAIAYHEDELYRSYGKSQRSYPFETKAVW